MSVMAHHRLGGVRLRAPASRPSTQGDVPAGREGDSTTSREVDPGPPKTEPDVLRSAVRGALLGFTIVLLAIGLGGTAAGMEPFGALGVGAFIGLLGGGGFGFMLGATTAVVRAEDAERRERDSGSRR
jgi:hypothetical protein